MIERLRTLRDAGAVTRFHTSRIRPQRLSEHSHGVAEIILAIRPSAEAALLVAALRHDVYELFTGDVPAPTKWDYPDLSYELSEVELKLDERYQLIPALSVGDACLLKWADMMELILYTFEELKGGNHYAEALMRNGLKAIAEYKLTPSDALAAKLLLTALNTEITLWTHAR